MSHPRASCGIPPRRQFGQEPGPRHRGWQPRQLRNRRRSWCRFGQPVAARPVRAGPGFYSSARPRRRVGWSAPARRPARPASWMVRSAAWVRRNATAATDLARPGLRRVGPPALRPGAGLRRPGLRPWTRATPGCPAEHRGPHPAPEATRPRREACATGCRHSRERNEHWEKSGRRSSEMSSPAIPQTNNDQRSDQDMEPDAHVSGPS